MKLINIDGPDGVGKTTLIEGLLRYFAILGKKVDFVHFPRYETEIGSLIKETLYLRTRMDPKSLQMLYSADRINFSKFDYPKLVDLDYLFVDRYITSGVVYGQIDELDANDIMCFDKETIKADLNIILTAPVNELMRRMSSRERDQYETEVIVTESIELFADISKWFDNVVYVSGHQAKELVLKETADLITEVLGG